MKHLFCTGLILPFLILGLLRADEPQKHEAARKNRPAASLIRISPETTRFTGPLRSDGTLDCAGALDRMLRQGVTPANNAAVPFWQATGPKGVPAEIRKEFFQQLQMEQPPEQGEHFLCLWEFLNQEREREKDPSESRRDEAYRQLEEAQKQPWAREDYSIIARWIRQNEKPMSILQEASRRPKYYQPMISKDGDLFVGSLISDMQVFRDYGCCLLCRAMMKIHEDKIPEAWEDILTWHRWARLYGSSPMLVTSGLGRGFDYDALRAGAILAANAPFSRSQAQKCLADIESLTPFPPLSRVCDRGQRLELVDIALDLAEKRPALEKIKRFMNKELVALAGDAKIDWNATLRYCQNSLDHVVKELDQPTVAQLMQTWNALCKESPKGKYPPLNPADRLSEKDRKLADLLIQGVGIPSPGTKMAVGLFPLIRGETQRQLTRLALALSAYKTEKGAYPDDLSALAPRYLPDLPPDPCTGGPWHYRRQGEGFVLYSVGQNQKDDGGKNYLADNNYHPPEDHAATKEEISADDIAIRTPSK
ncbi:MAG: hypothetical protein JXB10_16260 [Pirellulales bacterium]|nr:hypothetical protein [Pirellulales bacterium]